MAWRAQPDTDDGVSDLNLMADYLLDMKGSQEDLINAAPKTSDFGTLRTHHLPVSAPLITISDARQLFQTGKIFQHWVTSPDFELTSGRSDSPLRRIVGLILNDGSLMYFMADYDSVTEKIIIPS